MMQKIAGKLSAGKAIAEELFQFVVWLTDKVEKFPKSHKFSIGDRIQTQSLELLELVIEATYTKDRAALLRRAQLRVEQMRFLFRLCDEVKLLNHTAYEHAARSLDSIGRGIGGWLKAHHAQATRQPVRPDRDIPSAAGGGAQGDPR
ncbi:MAG: diversity-generating retroelement protein Avd [Terricaulis sp.]